MFTLNKKESLNFKYLTFLTLLFLFLTGCSPHPATGNWVSSADNDSNYTKAVVHFQARVEIYSNATDKAELYCGWSASSKQNLTLECMASEDLKDKEIYEFNIVNEKSAELKKQGKLLAQFKRLEE